MTEDCCGDVDITKVNPMDVRSGRRAGNFTLFSQSNPILSEIEDSRELKLFFEKWNFVPFRGSDKGSGHSVLHLFDLLFRRSPTHSGCIKKKSTYAFGTAATTMRAVDAEFDTGEEVVPPTFQDRKTYKEQGLSIVKFDRPLKDFFRQLSDDYQWSGQAWVQLNYSEVNGEASAFFKIHQSKNVLYLNTEPGEARIVGVSPKFEDEYLNRYEPEYLPMFPEFQQAGGVQKTMMHLKCGGNFWYGDPASISALENAFEEQQQTSYRIKSAHGEFSGKIIIETEGAEGGYSDPAQAQREYKEFVREFEENYTNRGKNPQGVVLAERPFGAKPMFVHDIPANTNHEYFTGISELDEKEILKAHQTTRRFMSLETGSRFTSQVSFVEDFVMNMEPVIYDLRHTILTFMNKGLSKVWEMAGREFLNEQSLWFGSPIDVSIEQFKKGLVIPDNTNNGFNNGTGSNG